MAFYELLVFAGKLLERGETTPGVLELPKYPFAYLIAFGMLTLIPIYVVRLLRSLGEAEDAMTTFPLWACGLIGAGVFFGLMFLKLHVGLSMMIGGFVGFILTRGLPAAESTLAGTIFEVATSPILVVIPLFVLMGVIAGPEASSPPRSRPSTSGWGTCAAASPWPRWARAPRSGPCAATTSPRR